MPGATLNLGSLLVQLRADASQYTKTMRQSQKMLKKVSSQMNATGRKMTRFITVPLALIGGAAIKAFASFDNAMTQSAAIMGNVSGKMRAEMEMTARELSGRGIQSATDLAKSYFFLASAGFNVKQSIGALPIVQRFATAGMFDMATATDLLTDAQSALGLTSKDTETNMKNMIRLSDILVKANTLANASVQQFSEALTTEAATAMKTYNIEIEEGIAILALYADKGIKGMKAGSMFGRMVRLLTKSIAENQEVFDAMNIDVEEFASTGKNLTGVLEGITKAVAGMGNIERTVALDTLGFQVRVQQTLLPLLGATDQIKKYTEGLKKAGGITKEVSDKQLKSFSSEMKILWNQITLVGIEIGQTLAPAIRMLGGFVKGAIGWWRKLNDTTKKWIVFLGMGAAAIGPLLLAGALVISMVGKMIAVFGALVFAANSASLAMMGPAGLAIAAGLTTIVGIVWAISKAFGGVTDSANKAKSAMKAFYKLEKDTAKGTFDTKGLTQASGSKDIKRYFKELANVRKKALKSGLLSMAEYNKLAKQVEARIHDIQKAQESIVVKKEKEFNIKKQKAVSEKTIEFAKSIFKETRNSLEQYQIELKKVDDLYAAGGTTLEIYNRKVDILVDTLTQSNTEHQKWVSQVNALWEQTRTPLERYDAQVKQINTDFKDGIGGLDIYNRRIEMINESFKNILISSGRMTLGIQQQGSMLGDVNKFFRENKDFVEQTTQALKEQGLIQRQLRKDTRSVLKLYGPKEKKPAISSPGFFGEVNLDLVAISGSSATAKNKKQKVEDKDNMKVLKDQLVTMKTGNSILRALGLNNKVTR